QLARSHARNIRVELHAAHPARARALVARHGGRVEAAYGDLVDAVVPVAALNALARDDAVRFVGEPAQPVPEDVRGQGVAATGAAAWQRAGGLGNGVKIAVLDLGFDGYRRSEANGDLPASLVKADFCPSGGFQATSHGTAVAE